MFAKTKKLILPVVLSVGLIGIYSCNSDDNFSEYEYTQSSSVEVKAFSLKSDKKVLDSLENVFFSIDLAGARIFNADSLPYGTKVSRLIPNITTSQASVVQLEFPRPGMTDSIVNYLTNSTDSIDFSNGPVKLRVKSENQLVERVYTINVNVHQVKPDSLMWDKMESGALSTSFAAIAESYTACMGDRYYTLTSNSSRTGYCMAITTDPAEGPWTTTEVTPGFTPDVTSLRATESALYILATDGSLYTSSDGLSWALTGEQFESLIGGYGNQLLCVRKETSGKYTHYTYPDMAATALDADFPVKGASHPASYTTPMGYTSNLVIVGGRTTDGTLSSAAWGYDGTSWARITRSKPLKTALEGMTLVAYDLFEVTSSTWAPEQYPALIAMGGSDGTTNSRAVYYSRDWGMTWQVAPELMNLPEDVPSFAFAPAYTYTTVMHKSRASQWEAVSLPAPPAGTRLMEIPAVSRASEPVTEWNAPAIYIFGGVDNDGNAFGNVWRARIRRYTFCPIQ